MIYMDLSGFVIGISEKNMNFRRGHLASPTKICCGDYHGDCIEDGDFNGTTSWK